MGLRFRFATLSMLLLPCACGPQDNVAENVGVAPTAREAQILNLALAGVTPPEGACLEPTISPTTRHFGLDALSFGDGKLARSGDGRFDRLDRIWARAKPDRSMAIRLPDQAWRLGIPVVENASSEPSCRRLLIFHLPRFEDDFAFVAYELRLAGVTGGMTHTSAFRLRRNRWEFVAVDTSIWGRPVF